MYTIDKGNCRYKDLRVEENEEHGGNWVLTSVVGMRDAYKVNTGEVVLPQVGF